MVIAAERREDRVGLVLRGCRRDELRRAAVCACERRYGAGAWRVCAERFRPAMVSRTGSVRLWEGSFELDCSGRDVPATRSPGRRA